MIVAAHKDTSVEDEAAGEDDVATTPGHTWQHLVTPGNDEAFDETSNVEVISLVSSPSLLIGEASKSSQNESSQKIQDPDEEDSDLIFQLVRMEVDAENQGGNSVQNRKILLEFWL